MTFPQGISFRATTAYVTDPANVYADTYGGNTTTPNYPVSTPQGNNVGWSLLNVGLSSEDLSNSIDPRLAGNVYASAGLITYKISLPAPGAYSCNMAVGDPRAGPGGTGNTWTVTVYDNTTLLATILNAVTDPTRPAWYDATGTLYSSSAAWATANPQGGGGTGAITLTFASTTALWNFSGSNSYIIPAHIWMQAATTPAAAPVHKRLLFGNMVGWTPSLGLGIPLLGGAAIKLGEAIRRNARVSRRSLLIGHHNRGPR